jgi:hypothetical protein
MNGLLVGLRLAVVVVLCSLAIGACGGASTPGRITGRSSVGRGDGLPPKTLIGGRATPAGPGGLRPGTIVSPDFTGVRVFANRRDGFAISDLPQAGDGTYPLATSNGGKTWRTDGPVLHIPAAQGALGVGEAGVLGPGFYFAWCGACNTVIDVTPDAGQHWWRTFMPGDVLGVLSGTDKREGLSAIVEGPPNTATRHGVPLWMYLSTDGRRWTYNRSLQGLI